MKTNKFLIALVAVVCLGNNNSWGQDVVDLAIVNNTATVQGANRYRIPTSWIESQPTHTTLDPFVIKVVAEYGIAGVEIGYDTNVFEMVGGISCPIGHPQDGQSATYISALLPGSYGIILNRKSDGYVWNIRYIVSYISDPWIGRDAPASMDSLNLSDSRFTNAAGKKIVAQNFVSLKLSEVFADEHYSKELIKIENGNIISIAHSVLDYQITSSGQYCLITTSGSLSPSEYLYFNVDIIGSSGSGVVEINRAKPLITPVFVQSVFFLQSDSAIQRVSLYSLTGSKEIETQGDIHEISVSHLPSGIYIVQVALQNGEISTQKIIKQ